MKKEKKSLSKPESEIRQYDSTSSQSDFRFKALFDNSSLAIYETDASGKCLLVNQQWCKFAGMTPEEAKGDGWQRALHPDDREHIFRLWNNFALQKKPWNFEYRFCSPGNVVTWVSGTSTPITNEKGEITGYLGMNTDISERKKVEEALRESVNNYRLLSQHLPGTTVLLFDQDLRFVLVEGHIHPQLGFTPDAMEGKTLWEVLPIERAGQLAPLYKKALEGKTTENLISNFKDSIYSVNILPVRNSQGEIFAGMVVSQDITEQRRSEEALQANYSLIRIAGETARFGGWSVNMNDNKVIWSGVVASIHELNSDYSPTVNEGINFYAPEWRDKIRQVYTNCSEKGIRYDEEMEIITAKGNRIWVRTTGEAVKDENGKIIKVQGAFQDINQRKKTEQALGKSEEKWRKLVQTIPDYVALYDRNGQYLFLNHFAEGFSMKDIEGKTFTDFLADDSKLIYKEAFNRAQQTKTTQYVEHKAFGNNRSIRSYESFFVPILENDEFENMMVIARDITGRKESEKSLIESETRLRLAELASKSGNWELHLESKLMIGSIGAKRIYGLDIEHFEYDVIKEVPLPEYRPVLDKAMELLIKEDKPYDLEFKISAVDTGEIKDIHSLARYNKEKGIVFGVIQDITERRQTEAEILRIKQQYDNLVSKIPVGVYILKTKPDGDFALEYTSPKMAEMLGLSVESLLAHNQTIFKAIHPDDLDSFVRRNQEGIQYKQPFDWKGRVVVKGDVRWLQISSLPQQLESGEMLWHGLIVDITERMQDEVEIKLKNEELINLNATKDKFFSIIAHDLKSPFNSIIGFSNLLVEHVSDKDYKSVEKYAQIIQNATQQTMDLLMNLLEWSRSQTGRMEFNPEFVEMVSLIKGVAGIVEASAHEKKISIVFQLPRNAPVIADKDMISTILRNLISNALKFTHPDGEIVVSAENLSTELVVSISDNGVGIKKESIGKLFLIEESYTTPGTNNERGTGLGLILCKEFIDKHGGKIWVESEFGKGSKFSFTIPK